MTEPDTSFVENHLENKEIDELDKDENDGQDEGIQTGEDINSCNTKNPPRKQREIYQSLINLSECNSSVNEDLMETIYVGGSLETIMCTWEKAVPNPRYVAPRRKKSIAQVQDNDTADNSSSYYQSVDPFHHSYEVNFVDCPSWRMAVEPLTYRFMPGSGRYRAYKLGQQLLSVGRIRDNKGSKFVHDRQKLKIGIQKELQPEFELFIEQEKQRSMVSKQKELAENKAKKEKSHKKHSQIHDESKTDITQDVTQESRNISNSIPQDIPSSQKEDVSMAKKQSKIDDFTPRSNLSILSSQTPLPPIAIPLISKDDEDEEGNGEKDTSNDNMERESGESSEKLWDMTSSVSSTNIYEMRRRSAPNAATPSELNVHSEPGTRVSSRNSDFMKSVRKDSHLYNMYKLKRLPTISDHFHHPSDDNSSPRINNSDAKQTLMVRKIAQPVNSSSNEQEPIRLYRHPDMDTISVTSEPPIAQSPVLQGSGYDLNKLTMKTNGKNNIPVYPHYQVNPEAVSLIDQVRAISQSTEGAIMKNTGVTGQDQTQLQYLAAKYNGSQRLLDDYSNESLENMISTKQFLNSKTRTGLNPYLRKPKVGSKAGQPFAGLGQGIEETFRTLPISAKPVSGMNRDEVMPDMLVRRAEKFMTNKRVI